MASLKKVNKILYKITKKHYNFLYAYIPKKNNTLYFE